MAWTSERLEQLKEMWSAGLSASRIADELGGGVTRNAVIGKFRDLKLGSRIKVPARAPAHFRIRPEIFPRDFTPISPLADIALAVSKRIALTELRGDNCHWPLGDPTKEEEFSFCGAAATARSGPYCEGHKQMAYTRTRPASPDVPTQKLLPKIELEPQQPEKVLPTAAALRENKEALLRHPALHIPDSSDYPDISILRNKLQASLLHIAKELSEEASAWIAYRFGLTDTHAKMLMRIAMADRKLSNQEICQGIITSNGAFNHQISKLKAALGDGVELTGRGTQSLNSIGLEKVKESLGQFHQSGQEFCQLVGIASLDITADDLPADISKLQNMLRTSLEFIRGKPEQHMADNRLLSPEEHILASMCDDAHRRGDNFLFYSRIKTAIFPPHLPQNTCIDVARADFLFRKLENLGIALPGKDNQGRPFLPIGEPASQPLRPQSGNAIKRQPPQQHIKALCVDV